MALNSPGHRSVSQSSLQSTAYRTQESTSNAPRQRSSSQPRLPFQSLNKTSIVLRPPGPLESMLKTTTETGDLGIYSINLPSLGTRHYPPRSRASHKDKRRQSRSRRNGFRYGATSDDRKLLPSYRDPTSEILSLYGGSQTPYSSSRRVPSYKSSGTFSSQRSNSGLQRPRSPFPYPARLKRPGVRPSSPAVTDDGLVDYRRMVEIDRSAHRTTSGSYMTRGHRRYHQYPPFSLRPEYSRSASSLPMRTSSAPYYGSGIDSLGALGGTIQLYPESSYRQFVAEDQSVRSASLTSIVEMYQGKSLDDSVQPIQSPCSVYYDYTEDCEETFPDQLLNGSPVCSSDRDVKDMSKENTVQDASIEIDIENKGDLVKGNNLATTTITERASAVQSSGSSEEDWVWDKPEHGTVAEDSQLTQDISCIPSKAIAPYVEERRPQTKENDAAMKLPSYLGPHRLNASTNIGDQNHTNKQATAEQNVQESKAHANILSPNPISPAHQLRLSNSIPQLMKALPPLPCEKKCNKQNTCTASYEDTEVHTNLLFADSPVDMSIPVRLGSGTGETSLEPVFGGKDLRTSSRQRILSQPQMGQSRFKVRVKPSQSSGLHSEWTADSLKDPGRSSSSPAKPRLRLKVSRNRVSSKLMNPDDIHVCNEGLRQHKSLLELGNVPRLETLLDRSSLGEAFEEQLTQLSADKPLSNIDEGTTRGYSPPISDQFDISYPSPTKGMVMAGLVPRSNLESSPDPFGRQQWDFVSRPSPRPLRYKTSGLPPNGVKRVNGGQLRAMSSINDINPATLGSDIVSDSSDDSTLAPSQITVMLSQRLRNKTLRVKRWVLELKRTVQNFVRAQNRRQ
ncbi:hypothetical protein FLAG1_00185 [Fusarium langsethiae]|uniref:Uncharacterized protein n=1 Tax=Fusarium langsethiae TaxID=179993 RepID=A0A0M9F6M1_FUSLA|nr:hypothetical protein FLAG1_00185 [Fusarium langsethiae]GKT97815.1 unnamed protein product [Fusarium langsethiae]GKU10738.1 unnamed protein product [Fusarium langsethiae]